MFGRMFWNKNLSVLFNKKNRSSFSKVPPHVLKQNWINRFFVMLGFINFTSIRIHDSYYKRILRYYFLDFLFSLDCDLELSTLSRNFILELFFSKRIKKRVFKVNKLVYMASHTYQFCWQRAIILIWKPWLSSLNQLNR